MLASDAVGRLAVAQEIGASATTSILTSVVGTFALAGENATFQVREVGTVGFVALAGQAIALQVQAPVASGSFAVAGISATFQAALTAPFAVFTLTGEAATAQVRVPVSYSSLVLVGSIAPLQVQLGAAFGACALSGQLAFFDPVEPVTTGFIALSGMGAFLSYELLGGGNSISGGTFSRQRWRDLLETQERQRAAEQRRIANARLRRRAEERRRRRAEAEARRAAREAEKQRGDTLVEAMVAEHHAAAERGLAELRDIAMAAGGQARHGHAAAAQSVLDRDDEDVIALLMGMTRQ
jgi:hypothetical protein